jgi:hypothetical protein
MSPARRLRALIRRPRYDRLLRLAQEILHAAGLVLCHRAGQIRPGEIAALER